MSVKKVRHPAIHDSQAVTNLGEKIKEAQKNTPSSKKPRAKIISRTIQKIDANAVKSYLARSDALSLAELAEAMGLSGSNVIRKWLEDNEMSVMAFRAFQYVAHIQTELSPARSIYVVSCDLREEGALLMNFSKLAKVSCTEGEGGLYVLRGEKEKLTPLLEILSQSEAYKFAEVRV